MPFTHTWACDSTLSKRSSAVPAMGQPVRSSNTSRWSPGVLVRNLRRVQRSGLKYSLLRSIEWVSACSGDVTISPVNHTNRARIYDIHMQTAYRCSREGMLPVPATGHLPDGAAGERRAASDPGDLEANSSPSVTVGGGSVAVVLLAVRRSGAPDGPALSVGRPSRSPSGADRVRGRLGVGTVPLQVASSVGRSGCEQRGGR